MFYENLTTDGVARRLQCCITNFNAGTCCLCCLVSVFLVLILLTVFLWIAGLVGGIVCLSLITLVIIGLCIKNEWIHCPRYCRVKWHERKIKKEYKKYVKSVIKFRQYRYDILLSELKERWIVIEITEYLNDLEQINDNTFLKDRQVIIKTYNLNQSYLADYLQRFNTPLIQ